MIDISKLSKKWLLIISSIILMIVSIVLFLFFSNQIGGCVNYTDCKDGYTCYNSNFWPKGGKYKQLGDLSCHKDCITNSDCSSGESCLVKSLFKGDTVDKDVGMCISK